MARRTLEVGARSDRGWCSFPREKNPTVGAFPAPAQQGFIVAAIPPCPQKARETGRVIVWPLSAMNTLRALVTSDPTFMGLTSFLNVRSIFLTMCQTSHTSCPQTELGPFSSKSVSPSVVHNSVNCSSFTPAPRLKIPGLTMTFFPQFLGSVYNALQACLKLCLSKSCPPSSLYPARLSF